MALNDILELINDMDKYPEKYSSTNHKNAKILENQINERLSNNSNISFSEWENEYYDNIKKIDASTSKGCEELDHIVAGYIKIIDRVITSLENFFRKLILYKSGQSKSILRKKSQMLYSLQRNFDILNKNDEEEVSEFEGKTFLDKLKGLCDDIKSKGDGKSILKHKALNNLSTLLCRLENFKGKMDSHTIM